VYTLSELLNFKTTEYLLNGFSVDPKQVNEVYVEYQAAEELKLTVIVPVYNNGDFLLNKCFASLRRSSMFDKMEILLYDCQKHLAKEIPLIDDLRDLEMFEILKMPVVRLAFQNEHPVRKNVCMRLKIVCCSYFQGCSFIYLFSGENWIFYMKFH
jgi:hypothetical protein